MNWNAVRKRLQRQSFDLLTQRHGLVIVIVSVVVIFVALVNFAESLTTWSAEKYAAVIYSFSDNVVGQSFRSRLCLPLPIDVVYTWVNGSDPLLLRQLRDYKESMSSDAKTVANTTEMSVCRYDNCVFANGIAIDPPVPPTISLRHLGLLYPALKNARTMLINVDLVTGHNVTLILFETKEVAETALNQKVVIQEKTANIRKLFYTTEKELRNTVLAENVIVMIGFPDELDNDQLIEAFPQEHRNKILQLTVHKEKGIAILTMSDNTAYNSVVNSQNISMSSKSPTFKQASFVWDLTDYWHSDAISASRFEDKDELRYSLRSVEKHAPWIRHIFIVTNGQIPSWLNLDNERVTVVPHSEIFVNESHLPTFSSPAIESHLHRIPGLADWFIYMNDDILFGRDVWPDDFVTASGAQKVYLTWPVPNCNNGCPASWISDGYCDRACNNSQCEWDGGDCTAGGGRAQYPLYGLYDGAQSGGHLLRSTELYCNPGCANNWIADRYCDQSCNVRACGFDAADCGTDNFCLLRRIDLHKDVNHYDAQGTDIVYFNLSTLLPDESNSVESGIFSQDSIVRSASVARKFKVVTVVLYNNETQRMLNFSLLVKDVSGKNFTYNFTITVDTLHMVEGTSAEVIQLSGPTNTTAAPETEQVESFTFISSASRKFPKPKYSAEPDTGFKQSVQFENITEDDIPPGIKNEYYFLVKQYDENELTLTGFNLMLHALMKKYTQSMEIANVVEAVIAKDQFKSRNMSFSNRKFTSQRHHAKPKELFYKRNEHRESTFNYQFVRKDRLLGRRLNYNYKDLPEDGDNGSPHSLHGHLVVPDIYTGFLPWEKFQIFPTTTVAQDNTGDSYETDKRAGKRHLLDTYADSLRHVSKVYNRAYGYTARRVPGHVPHMINRHAASAMQEKFAEEWDLTSSHRIRHSDDMQFAFSYYYYLMSEPVNSSIDELFSEIDIDKSGALSDREVRILATRIYELPIDLLTLEGLERTIINCSQINTTITQDVKSTSSQKEVYYDKRMPQVTLNLIKSCPVISDALQKLLRSRTKYEFEVLGDDNIMFKKLNANVSRVVAILDEVRQQPRKFICLNDDIDYEQSSAKMVKAVLRDFYESLFPKPSPFELSSEYRNKFLHVRELHEWWYSRAWLRRFAIGCLFVAAAFTLVSFYCNRVCPLRRWLLSRR